jgi:hypothetical protein
MFLQKLQVKYLRLSKGLSDKKINVFRFLYLAGNLYS